MPLAVILICLVIICVCAIAYALKPIGTKRSKLKVVYRKKNRAA